MTNPNPNQPRRLVPKPHLIKSIRARGDMSLVGCVSEFVDNSIGHGKSSKIDILILNGTGIGVFDDGIGIDDINRFFTLGDASAHDDLAEIGQFGVGATDSSIYLGDMTMVKTVRDGRYHEKRVNWREVEKSGEWPWAYEGDGRQARKDQKTGQWEKGTEVHITQPAQKVYQLETSEKLAKELGLLFAPGLKRGLVVNVYHELKSGGQQQIAVVPFEPENPTHITTISGEIPIKGGHVLKWKGKAMLSASLTERYNGVHIAFAHRVIEHTRDPFMGASAPTLYVEVTLDSTTPWKHALADHKNKVVKYRQDLMDSIYVQLKQLLDESAHEAKYLALLNMTAPIELSLTQALKEAGVLYHDPDAEPLGKTTCGGTGGGGGGGGGGGTSGTKDIVKPTDSGEPAKEIERPTGVKITWKSKEWLEGRLWDWEISGKSMIVTLDKDWYDITQWPQNTRSARLIDIVAGYLSHALEVEYWNKGDKLSHIVTKKLYKQIQLWADSDMFMIAPFLNRAILEAVVT